MSRDGYDVVASLPRGEEAEMLGELLASAGMEALVEDSATTSERANPDPLDRRHAPTERTPRRPFP